MIGVWLKGMTCDDDTSMTTRPRGHNVSHKRKNSCVAKVKKSRKRFIKNLLGAPNQKILTRALVCPPLKVSTSPTTKPQQTRCQRPEPTPGFGRFPLPPQISCEKGVAEALGPGNPPPKQQTDNTEK